MFNVKENALYTKEDIQARLGDSLDVDTFLSRLRPRKTFKNLYRGKDLLEAWDRCLSNDTGAIQLLNRKVVIRNNAEKSARQDRIDPAKVFADT